MNSISKNNGEHFKVLILAKLGFSVKFISTETLLEKHEVVKIYRKEGIFLRDYRDGETQLAKRISRYASNKIDNRRIEQKVKNLLLA